MLDALENERYRPDASRNVGEIPNSRGEVPCKAISQARWLPQPTERRYGARAVSCDLFCDLAGSKASILDTFSQVNFSHGTRFRGIPGAVSPFAQTSCGAKVSGDRAFSGTFDEFVRI